MAITGKASNAMQRALGWIDSARCLLDKYPVIGYAQQLTEFLLNGDPISMLLELLKRCGYGKEEITEKLSELLAGVDNDGVKIGLLAKCETLIKVALKAYTFTLFNCNANPILEDRWMYSGSTPTRLPDPSVGFQMRMEAIDPLGVMKHNPFKDVNYYKTEEIKEELEDLGMTFEPKNLYATSIDFNAFLWYVINKADASTEEGRVKCEWPQANAQDERIAYFQYVENGGVYGDMLRLALSPNKYRRHPINKTIIHFNFDYINNLHLVSTKILLNDIIHRILGDAMMLLTNLSVEYKEWVDTVVEKIIREDDTEIEDCYFNFSNEEFQSMMDEAERKIYGEFIMDNGTQTVVDMNSEEVLEKISGISDNATLVKQKSVVKDVIESFHATKTEGDNVTIGFGDVDSLGLIKDIMKMIVLSLVESLFSPQVMILLYVDDILAGGDGRRLLTPDEAVRMVFQVAQKLIIELKNELLNWAKQLLMEKIGEIIELLTNEFMLERIKYIRNLVENLLDLIRRWSGTDSEILANVGYADIIDDGEVSPKSTYC